MTMSVVFAYYHCDNITENGLFVLLILVTFDQHQ